MSKQGPILLVDDDPDDVEILKTAIHELGYSNPILAFYSCEDAFLHLIDHLSETPFIIISDINIPKINGLELKRMIDESSVLRRKSIPFVYYSTSATKRHVEIAFEYSIQGFFVKGTSFDQIKNTLRKILEYWTESKQPN